MKLHRISAILLRQYYLFKSSPARMVPLFIWAAVDIVLWGFITRYLSANAAPGGALVTTLLGTVLLWDFLTRVMQGAITTFFEDVWSRNFLNTFATPLTVTEYIVGLSISGIATSLIGLAVMLVIAIAGFGLAIAAYGAATLLFVSILLIFGVALGIFGSALALRLGPGVEWVIWPIPAMLSPFACVFYPLATLPHWMQAIAYTLPPMYVFEGMRAMTANGHFSEPHLIGGFVLALFYVALAGWCFIAVYRHAVRSGLIARYSAESVN